MTYRTIIVDDEPPALIKLEYLLKDYKNYELLGSFDNVDEALSSADAIRPQVAFLDIAMPGLSGIDLADRLRERCGQDLKVVFVTAYDQYAVTAFDINATDYLMKPVGRDRFQKSIEKLDLALKSAAAPEPERGISSLDMEGRPMVHAFGRLEITGAAEPAPTWRTAKVRELFAMFLQHRPDGIYRGTLLETLWDGQPEDKALANLNTCNYYLRKFLEKTGTDISLEYRGGYYKLNLGNALCDLDLFADAENMAGQINSDNETSILQAASLYRGRYLEDVKCTWANLLRDQYDMRYAELRVKLAEYYRSQNRMEDAVGQAVKAIQAYDLCEKAWVLLLKAYDASGDKAHFERTLANREEAYRRKGSGKAPAVDLSLDVFTSTS